MPDEPGGGRAALVVLAHGHGGTRHENGGFTDLAAMLGDVGIASIRVDFPGCGDSTEAFTHNNITNMLQDLEASLEFALAQPDIDKGRVGIVGYSMGGRLAMLVLGDEPGYSAAVLWAPVAIDGHKPLFGVFGGEKRYEKLRRYALHHGSVLFKTPWGQEQQLALRFFDENERSMPLSAIARFRGHLLVLHGSADKVIDQDNGRIASQAALSTESAELHIISGAGHDLGFYAQDPDTRALVLERTVAFFRDKLAAD
jgi:dipeptidyl aminopeptidase/acylaminoacyl peptidase